MVLASCVEEKNLYNPDEGTPEDAQLGLSTDFLLKTQRSIFITAVDGDGKSQAGVKFGVFMSQPYTAKELFLLIRSLSDIRMLQVS